MKNLIRILKNILKILFARSQADAQLFYEKEAEMEMGICVKCNKPFAVCSCKEKLYMKLDKKEKMK